MRKLIHTKRKKKSPAKKPQTNKLKKVPTKKNPNKAQLKKPWKERKKPNKQTGRVRTCNCSCKLQVLKTKSSGSVPLLRLIFIKVKSIPSRAKKWKPDKGCHHHFCSSELLWIIYLLFQVVWEKWDCGCHRNVCRSVLFPWRKRTPQGPRDITAMNFINNN